MSESFQYVIPYLLAIYYYILSHFRTILEVKQILTQNFQTMMK